MSHAVLTALAAWSTKLFVCEGTFVGSIGGGGQVPGSTVRMSTNDLAASDTGETCRQYPIAVNTENTTMTNCTICSMRRVGSRSKQRGLTYSGKREEVVTFDYVVTNKFVTAFNGLRRRGGAPHPPSTWPLLSPLLQDAPGIAARRAVTLAHAKDQASQLAVNFETEPGRAIWVAVQKRGEDDPDQYWIGRALSMEQYTESRVRAGAASGAEGRTLAPCPPPRLGRKTQGARAHPPIL